MSHSLTLKAPLYALRHTRLALVFLSIGFIRCQAARAGEDPPPVPEASDGTRYESVVSARRQRGPGQMRVVSGRELLERGATNLAEALDLLPELSLRPSGRGATRVDFLGVRQTSVLILVDGVPVNEPYFGDFDLSSIPVTDIVFVRVSLVPASPLEGPGGDGGVVDVETRRAAGGRRLDVRLGGTTSPALSGAVSGRAPLSRHLSLRASAGGGYGVTTYPATAATGATVPFGDLRSQAQTALRLEYETSLLRLTADVFYQHRRYAAVPGETAGAAVTDVPSEDALRAGAGVEGERGGFRLALSAYGTLLYRTSDFYRDVTLAKQTGHEDARAYRVGTAAHADRALGPLFRLSARLSLDTEGATVADRGLAPVAGRQTFADLAIGGRLRWRWLRMDGAAGVAAELGELSSAWPEAQLRIALVPSPLFHVQLTGARKGRVPTINERFNPNQGNPDLHPEQTTYLGMEVVTRPIPLIEARFAAYARRTEGLIQLNATHARFANLEEVRVLGFDASIDVARGRLLGGGLAYLFGDADSPAHGLDPLSNFPRHRLDAWLSSTWRGQLGGFLRFRYVGERIDNTLPLLPYVTLDLSVFWRFHKNLFLSARIDNLLDEHYALRATISGPPRTAFLALSGTWE